MASSFLSITWGFARVENGFYVADRSDVCLKYVQFKQEGDGSFSAQFDDGDNGFAMMETGVATLSEDQKTFTVHFTTEQVETPDDIKPKEPMRNPRTNTFTMLPNGLLAVGGDSFRVKFLRDFSQKSALKVAEEA